MQGAPRKKEYHCSFHIAPKKIKKNWILQIDFWVNNAKKTNKKKLGHYTYCNLYMQGAPRKKQYHCFFRGTPKTSGRNDFFSSILGAKWHKTGKVELVSRLCILKLTCTGCSTKVAKSLLHSRSTENCSKEACFCRSILGESS